MDDKRPKSKEKLDQEIEKDKFKKLMNAVRDLNFIDNNGIEKGLVTTTYHLLCIGIIEKEDAQKILREILRKYRKENKNTVDMQDLNPHLRNDNKEINKKNEPVSYMEDVKQYYDSLNNQKDNEPEYISNQQ